jgi:hypothetical protein
MKNESGRSMVEMLGVLAIIGVLSIGGIAGYTLAMNRYRANEILDAAAKIAVVAMSKDGGVGNTANEGDIPGLALKGATGISSTKDGEVTIKGVTSEDVKKLIGDISGNKIGDKTIKFE